MSKKFGLGKGLDALIPSEGKSKNDNLLIPINKIITTKSYILYFFNDRWI